MFVLEQVRYIREMRLFLSRYKVEFFPVFGSSHAWGGVLPKVGEAFLRVRPVLFLKKLGNFDVVLLSRQIMACFFIFKENSVLQQITSQWFGRGVVGR